MHNCSHNPMSQTNLSKHTTAHKKGISVEMWPIQIQLGLSLELAGTTAWRALPIY